MCESRILPEAGWVETLISLLINKTWVALQVPSSRLSHQRHQDNILKLRSDRENQFNPLRSNMGNKKGTLLQVLRTPMKHKHTTKVNSQHGTRLKRLRHIHMCPNKSKCLDKATFAIKKITFHVQP